VLVGHTLPTPAAEQLVEQRWLDEPAPRRRRLPEVLGNNAPTRLMVLAILGAATFLRVWQFNRLGLNSDEAVYAGQGAAIANDGTLESFFPAFRAHPLLFQTLLSVGAHLGALEVFGRLLSAVIGVATVLVTYRLGELLYGRTAGVLAALFLALMPYHVIVSRQILLDGPMVFFATVTLYLLARFAVTQRPGWLYATGATMGLTVMAKEGGVLLLGAIYMFLALSPEIRITGKQIAASLAMLVGVIAVFPLSLVLAGTTQTGGNYLAWQLFRRPNHDWLFYIAEVPPALGILLVFAALAGLWLLRRRASWRETLLLVWIAVPLIFLQLWPVKGFQYLLPIAPAVAVLAARTLAQWRAGHERLGGPRRFRGTAWVVPVVATAIAVSLAVTSWGRIARPESASFLAGSGGVPGGREAGEWIKHHVPRGAQLLTLGPSMANILQVYGHRKAYGLSVSPNPLNRNPAYEALANPDELIRSNELQYVVWDAYSAARSEFFSRRILRYTDRYHGRAIHTETVQVKTPSGKATSARIITIYEVRP
jgi:4-amino-4-deoxy-L-arabinose transferase-like glycosyltransferase